MKRFDLNHDSIKVNKNKEVTLTSVSVADGPYVLVLIKISCLINVGNVGWV